MIETRINPVYPLTSEVLDTMERPTDEPGYLLSSLAYTLLWKRVENYHGIKGRIFNRRVIHEVLSAWADYAKTNTRGIGPHILAVAHDNSVSIQDLHTAFENVGYTALPMVETFLSRQAGSEAAVMINQQTNAAAIFIHTTDYRYMNAAFSFFPMLYPAYFKEKPATEEEKQMLRTLVSRTKGSFEFVEELKNLMRPYAREIMLEAFRSKQHLFKDRRIADAETQISDARANIEDILDRYRTAEATLQQAIINYEGLKAIESNTSEEMNELLEYISNCNQIRGLNFIRNNKLQLDICTRLTNFNPRQFNSLLDRGSIIAGYRIPSDSAFANSENRKLFLSALFGSSRPSIFVRMRGRIILDLSRNFMEAAQNPDFAASEDQELYDSISNPHYALHGCPGQYRDQIMDCLNRGDKIAAIECSIAATGSVNVAETEVTFRPFIQQLLTTDRRFIETPEGMKTPEEALLWLLKKEKDETLAAEQAQQAC